MGNRTINTYISLLEMLQDKSITQIKETENENVIEFNKGKIRGLEIAINLIKGLERDIHESYKKLEKDIKHTYYKMFNTQKEYTIIDKLDENLSLTDIPVPSYIRFEISTMNPERVNVVNNVNSNIFENLTIDQTLHLLEFINFQ